MKVLIGFEYSQIVCKEFRKRGHKAFSCDLKETLGKRKWHYKEDFFKALYRKKWDLIIVHIPCHDICVSGAKWFKKKFLNGKILKSLEFFRKVINALEKLNVKYIIENPIGLLSSVFRKPDQIIQPWQFGDKFQKSTCLWLKGVKPLKPTKIVNKGKFIITKQGKKMPEWYNKKRNGGREITFKGIAKAMAKQWG